MKNKIALLTTTIFALAIIGLSACSTPAKSSSVPSKPAEPASQSQVQGELKEYTITDNSGIEDTKPEQEAGEGAGVEIMARINADTEETEYSTDGGNTWSTEAPEGL